MKENDDWDLEIRPRAKVLDINLSEVWRYRDLLWLFVRRDFVAQYKQTVLGPVWHFIQPILTTIMFLFIFGRVARIPTDGIPPVLFYISGITLWNYFSLCLTSTSSTFITNASIFGKVYFPRIIMPVSVVISNIIRFGIQSLLLISAVLYYHFNRFEFHLSATILLVPLLIFLMAGIGLGLGIIISSITTKYRDFTVLLGFAVQLLMYATPIAYPMSYVNTTKYSWLIKLNPLSSIVEAFRYALFQRGAFTPGDLLYTTVFMIVVLVFGLVLFNRVEKTFMDTV